MTRCPEATALSTNSDLARLDCFDFGQMDSQQPLFNASADFRRVDAGIEIENAAILASLSFTMHGSPEFARQRAVAAEDQFAVLDGDFDTLLVYAGHFHFESVPVSILVKVHAGREILHALSHLTGGFDVANVLIFVLFLVRDSSAFGGRVILAQLRLTWIFFGLASSAFGNVTVNTPSS